MKASYKLAYDLALSGLLLTATLGLTFTSATSSAATFVEPTEWDVGDLNTTYQEWTAGGTNAQPINGAEQLVHSANPALNEDPVLTQTGAFIAGSGGFYSASGNYTISAEILSHSPTGALGTYIMVQAASTVNPDYDPEENSTGGGVLRDSVKIYDSTGTLLQTSVTAEVTRTFYDSNYPLFGGVGYEEILWEIFVPDLVGDFRVTTDVMVHSSLQAVRIDSLVSVPNNNMPGDFDGDVDVDGADFVVWQTNFPKQENATLATGDADGDGDVDGADFVIWQTNFPFTPGSSASPVPEPNASLLALLGFGSGLFIRSASRQNRRINP